MSHEIGEKLVLPASEGQGIQVTENQNLDITFSIYLGHPGDPHSVDLPGHHLCPGPHDCPDRPHPPGPVLQGQSPQGQVCPGH